ncbi:hypothetical protein OSTOST_01433 [Ostertagia ostertagi]
MAWPEGELACKLYQVDYEKLINSMLKPRVKVGTEWVNKGQNLEQVNWAVGALAKALYARMFAWLIKSNKLLCHRRHPCLLKRTLAIDEATNADEKLSEIAHEELRSSKRVLIVAMNY